MKRQITIIFLFISFLIQANYSQGIEKGLNGITENVLKSQLEFLASDWTEGRATAQKGAYMAADYIASMLQLYGLKPAGDVYKEYPTWIEKLEGKKTKQVESYFQKINLIETTPGTDHSLAVITEKNSIKKQVNFNFKTDFSLRPGDLGNEISAPVVFAGYGYVDEANGYNDFEDVDVEGKIVLRLEGYPGHKDTTSAAYKKLGAEKRSYWRILQEKNEEAAKRGAVAVIEFSPDYDYVKRWASNVPFRYNEKDYESDTKRTSFYDKALSLPNDKIENNLTTVNISRRVASFLIEGTNIDFANFENQVKASLKPESVIIKQKLVLLKTSVESKIVQARNVIGMIEGENKDEIVVLGAHYDHVGKYDGYVYNGADDNGSGTVGIMSIAKAFMESGVKPKRSIIFALWTGEEVGLFGSKYFADHFKDREKIVFYMNFDMISRNGFEDSTGTSCYVDYTSTYQVLQEILEKNVDKYKLDLNLIISGSAKPSGGSDHSSFAEYDIPVYSFFSGFHSDYHRATDHVDKVNFEKMLSLTKLGFLNIWEIANMEEKLSSLKK